MVDTGSITCLDRAVEQDVVLCSFEIRHTYLIDSGSVGRVRPSSDGREHHLSNVPTETIFPLQCLVDFLFESRENIEQVFAARPCFQIKCPFQWLTIAGTEILRLDEIRRS
jgi:hypothetical protein